MTVPKSSTMKFAKISVVELEWTSQGPDLILNEPCGKPFQRSGGYYKSKTSSELDVQFSSLDVQPYSLAI